MKRSPSTGLCLTLSAVLTCVLTGCADLNDTGLSALSTRVPAFAIINDQLLQGEISLFPDHTGTVNLRGRVVVGDGADGVVAAMQPPSGTIVLNSCVGRLRYTATTMGSIDLRCNDGSVVDLRVALIGETRGYGYGQTSTGLASLTFGLSTVESRAHLTVPANRQLMEGSDSSYLELR